MKHKIYIVFCLLCSQHMAEGHNKKTFHIHFFEMGYKKVFLSCTNLFFFDFIQKY